MDALPIVVNRHQLELLHQQANQAIATLQNKQDAFSSNNKQKEQNLATYGTDNYQEAQTLVQAIADELKSHLQAWNDAPETTKPVQLSLNSYQLKTLRTSLDAESKADGNNTAAITDIIEQLPESSPQENAD